MNPALHWSLRPLPTVARAFQFVLDNISNRLLEIAGSTEYKATMHAIRCLVENAIDVLRGASDTDILVHSSILNSVIVCVLKHLFLNPSNLSCILPLILTSAAKSLMNYGHSTSQSS